MKNDPSSPNALHRFHFVLLALLSMPVAAQEPTWYLISHDDGCVELSALTRAKRLELPRPPVSPDDFAQMMRERGESPVVAMPAGFPPHLVGKVVQVTVNESTAPVFVTEEVCGNIAR